MPAVTVLFRRRGRESCGARDDNTTEGSDAVDILARLDQARRSTDVLEHLFYRRWSAGGLRPGELALYAGQCRHAVAALAQASALAAERAPASAREGLERHAEEEQAHLALWDAFAGAAGCEDPAPALERTRDCCHAWIAGEAALEHLAVLYVLEAGQPAISRTKLDGLVRHYGYSEEGPATEYFRLHETLDVEHAAAARRLIGELLGREPEPAALEERMLAGARAALRGNWELLDEVEAAAA
jgi:pyrroloquinoline quinone (PQQ) biosynthesis protein C